MASETIEVDELDVPVDGGETAKRGATVKVRPAKSAVRSAPARRPRAGSTADGAAAWPRGSSTALVGILGALLAVFVVAAGFFGYHYFAGSGPADESAARAQVVQIAGDYAVKLSSFDYRDLDKNRSAITAMSTEEFGKKYDEMVKALTEIVSNGKGVATAEVVNSAVESISGDKATVILFVNQKARNVVAPDGKNQPYRMVVKLARTDGRWLVDDVQTV